MTSQLPADLLNALAAADRSPGWNNRSRDVLCFDVEGNFGQGCTLYIVPFRRWAYRRQELATAAYLRGRVQA